MPPTHSTRSTPISAGICAKQMRERHGDIPRGPAGPIGDREGSTTPLVWISYDPWRPRPFGDSSSRPFCTTVGRVWRGVVLGRGADGGLRGVGESARAADEVLAAAAAGEPDHGPRGRQGGRVLAVPEVGLGQRLGSCPAGRWGAECGRCGFSEQAGWKGCRPSPAEARIQKLERLGPCCAKPPEL
jgi:hypothetical protein